MKKLLTTSLTLSLVLSVVPSVYAQSFQASDSGHGKLRTMEMKMPVKEMKEQKNLMKDARKASDSANKMSRAHIMNADLTAINGTSLTVTKDGKTYTVTTSATTKFRRHFGGISSLAELSVGNKIDVSGEWADIAGTTIAAGTIRDRSIMKRHGVFLGDVTSISGTTISIMTKNRGVQTVTVSQTTRYVNRKEEIITLANVLVGHKIRVKGVWDKSKNTITEVTQVKDFTLPAKESSASATPPPTATTSALQQ